MSKGAVPPVGAERTLPSLASKRIALARPGLYPDRPTAVEVIETHFALVFLTGRFAYKLKKPVGIRGADLTTLAAREAACREELRLNRRLASDTYVDVVPLCEAPAGLALGGSGAVVDWLVQMHQLPRAHMLDVRLRQNRVQNADLVAIVRAIVGLHRNAPPEPIGPPQAVRAIEARIDEALTELGRPAFALPATAVRELAVGFAAILPNLRPLLRARAAAGCIREGHGDLRAEHISLAPPVQIIDALEVDRALRLLDPAEDLAMLAVDLERQGGAWAVPELVSAYRELAADAIPESVWSFYLGLRAATRAKVAIWHLESPDEYPDAEPWRRSALSWIGRSAAWLGRCGLSGPA